MNATEKKTWQDELTELAEANDGALSPAIVLEKAEDKSSALHSKFEWNQGAAAHAYRLMQAAGLIRACRVRVVISPHEAARVVRCRSEAGYDSSVRLRQFVHTTRYNDDANFASIDKALSHAPSREQLIEERLTEMESAAKWLETYGFAANVKPIYRVAARIRKLIAGK